MQMPSLNEFNSVIDQLLQSLKYIKFNKLVYDLFLKALKPIEKLLQRIFENSGLVAGGAMTSAKVILIVIVLFVVILLIIFTVFWIKHRKKKRRVKSILGEKIHKDATVLDFLEKSKIYEEQGAYRHAIRLRFIAVLFYLHENHYLYHDSTMTGKEMVDRLKKDQFCGVDSFEIITQQFNTAWYGMDESNEKLFIAWKDNENRFWQEVQR